MKLQDIGFYTLTDERARNASATSPLSRCELILTRKCNFRCTYCRGSGPARTATLAEAVSTVGAWADDGLGAVRFSGGEPTLWPGLAYLVRYAKQRGIGRIAISTNGSSAIEEYERLARAGVNDFSVSLDACDADTGDRISRVPGSWLRVMANLRGIAKLAYTTVGIVVTPANVESLADVVALAHEAGAADVRIIPAAQTPNVDLVSALAGNVVCAHPILAYRLQNMAEGKPLRGLTATDNPRCPLALDDMAVSGGQHYPCIIYMREGGAPIGRMGPGARAERAAWAAEHDCYADPICRQNCLDVCVAYNNRVAELQ